MKKFFDYNFNIDRIVLACYVPKGEGAAIHTNRASHGHMSGNKKLAFFGLLCYTVYIKIHIIYIMPLKVRRIGDEYGRKKYYKN